MADGEGSRDHEDLPDVRGEPEPDWVEGIRRRREERAERLKSLLAPPPTDDAVRDEPVGAPDRTPGTPEPPA